MSSLTDISVQVRKIAFIAVGVIIGIIILQALIRMAISYWKATHPVVVKIPPPNVRFQKLPEPEFSIVERSSAGIQYILQNIEGKPPETTESARVYTMPKKLPSLLSDERATKFAARFGFTSSPSIENPTLYKYIDSELPIRTLSLDIVNMNFHLKTDFGKNPENIFSSSVLLNREKSTNEVKGFLSGNALFDDMVRKGNTTFQPLQYNNNSSSFIPASSLSSANAVRFDFFRTDIDSYKVVPPGFDKSYTYIIYTDSKDSKLDFLEVKYVFWPIAFDNYGTYPIRSGELAWQELLDGKASVVRMGNNTPERVVIRNINLAYYDSEEPQLYIQPIYVFEGDNNFVAYLPAVSADWLE